MECLLNNLPATMLGEGATVAFELVESESSEEETVALATPYEPSSFSPVATSVAPSFVMESTVALGIVVSPLAVSGEISSSRMVEPMDTILIVTCKLSSVRLSLLAISFLSTSWSASSSVFDSKEGR